MAIFRAIASVIVGYFTMFVAIFATFTVAYLMMGNGAFEEGSYDVSTLWIVLTCVLGLIAAILGGLVSALIAVRGSKAPTVLAALVLVLGLLMAIPVITAPKDEEPAARTGEVSNIEAMQNAQQPVLTALLNPLIGAVGIIIGARVRGGRSKPEA